VVLFSFVFVFLVAIFLLLDVGRCLALFNLDVCESDDSQALGTWALSIRALILTRLKGAPVRMTSAAVDILAFEYRLT